MTLSGGNMRHKITWIGCLVVPAVLAAGCESTNHTEAGAVGGGILGAGVGAVAGGLAHAPLAGAAIGAVTGSLVGGAVGHANDRAEQRAVAARRTALSIQDIVYMTQSHVSDGVIINQIRASGALYDYLTANDIAYLKSQGVSDVVICEMQATATPYPRRVYTAAPVYVVEPAPPPPVGVAIGIRGRF
jgi:hypothetical protein